MSVLSSFASLAFLALGFMKKPEDEDDTPSAPSTPVLPDPDTIHEGFYGFVARQNPLKKYDYDRGTECAYAQYLRSSGFPNACVRRTSWVENYPDPNSKVHRIPLGLAAALMTPDGGRGSFASLRIRLDYAGYGPK